MKPISLFYALLLAAAFVLRPLSAQDLLDRIVAVVDDEVILDSEVTQAAWMMASQMGVDPAREPQRFLDLRKAALKNLVNKELLVIQADNDTIKADERQVESYLEQQLQAAVQQAGGENRLEEALGMPMSQIRRLYRKEIEKELRANTVQEKKLSKIKLSPREVRDFFESKKDSLGRINESVDISHILIEVRPGEKARRGALAKAMEIRKRLLEGEDFAELAKLSDDPGSAARGGDLGFMPRSDFVREYAEAALKLQPGELSEVVETQFGFHIIRLEEKRGDKIHTRHILVAVKPTKEDELAAAEKIKAIHQELMSGANLEELAAKYSDDESTKDDRGHLGRYEVEQLRRMAKEFLFALSGLKPGEISDPVKTQYGFHILKLNGRESAREYSLETDYDRIEQMAINYKRQQELQKWLEELKKQVYIEYKDPSLL